MKGGTAKRNDGYLQEVAGGISMIFKKSETVL